MPEKLKDILFNIEKVKFFAETIHKVYPEFDIEGFINTVCDKDWASKELKQKMRHTTISLYKYLPQEYSKAIDVLLKIVPFVKGFEAIVLPDYVEVYGLDFWDISMPALGEFTKCGSSEFGIRPFLIKDLEGAMVYMSNWADDKDFRVRRFASEGCRPRLPWGMGIPELKKNPDLIFPVLEKLKNDNEEFVRKSVANNLNDISKDHPERVLDICEQWYGKTKNTNWIVKHACRTLLKQGNKRAMTLFGFASPNNISVNNLIVSDRSPRIGSYIYFSFNLEIDTKSKQKIRIEYLTHFVKANGKTLPKIFHIKEVELKPRQHTVKKKHSFANLSTRKHYPGLHTFEIVVNGEKKGSVNVNLLEPNI